MHQKLNRCFQFEDMFSLMRIASILHLIQMYALSQRMCVIEIEREQPIEHQLLNMCVICHVSIHANVLVCVGRVYVFMRDNS